MIFHIDDRERCKISDCLENAIANALKNASESEPQLVANLVHQLSSQINGLKLDGRYSLSAGGIFIHASPLVNFNNNPKSVELGDLLLLRTEKQNGEIQSRSALLLQAKKINKNARQLKPDNEIQHELYAKWPSFKYVRSSSNLNGKRRHITGPDLYNACQYLLLTKTTNEKCILPCYPKYSILCKLLSQSLPHVLIAQPTQPYLSHYRCLLNELTSFLLGNAGKAYTSPPPKRTRGWDKVIDDLINVTAQNYSSYMKKSGASNNTRGQGIMCFMMGSFSNAKLMQTRIQAADDRWENPPEILDKKVDEGGIPIIEFTINHE